MNDKFCYHGVFLRFSIFICLTRKCFKIRRKRKSLFSKFFLNKNNIKISRFKRNCDGRQMTWMFKVSGPAVTCTSMVDKFRYGRGTTGQFLAVEDDARLAGI